MVRPFPVEADLAQYYTKQFFDKHNNWGRWGKDDQLGTLNYITPDKRLQAAAQVKVGVTVSCSKTITYGYPRELHFMQVSAASSSDWVGFGIHGPGNTHIDAICHFFWEGKTYNGYPADRVNNQGAMVANVEAAKEAIVTRGVLLDFPRLFGVNWLECGEAIRLADVLEAERAQGITVEPGDALLVRVGTVRRHRETGHEDSVPSGRAGLHGDCLDYLHGRQVALLGCDAASDAFAPVHYRKERGLRIPIHQVGIPGMGLWFNRRFEPGGTCSGL